MNKKGLPQLRIGKHQQSGSNTVSEANSDSEETESHMRDQAYQKRVEVLRSELVDMGYQESTQKLKKEDLVKLYVKLMMEVSFQLS